MQRIILVNRCRMRNEWHFLINEKFKMLEDGNAGMSIILWLNQIQFEGFCTFNIDQGLNILKQKLVNNID